MMGNAHAELTESSIEGHDITPPLQRDLSDLTGLEGQWSLSPGDRGIERLFKFKTFKAAWAFMNGVAAEAQSQRHHPEWSNVYDVVFIRWTTHDIAGISAKDIILAKFCDELAKGESWEIGGMEKKHFGPALSALADQAIGISE